MNNSIRVLASAPGEVDTARETVSVEAALAGGETIAVEFGLERGQEFLVNLQHVILSASQKIVSARQERGPDFVVPLRVKEIGVLPDLLGQTIAVTFGNEQNRVLWALDLETAPRLIASLQAAIEKAEAATKGTA